MTIELGHAPGNHFHRTTHLLKTHPVVETPGNLILLPHLQDSPASAHLADVFQGGLHQVAADAPPPVVGGHGHIGDLPASAATGRPLHSHIPHQLAIFDPDKAVEDVLKLACAAGEQTHQPAHVAHNS